MHLQKTSPARRADDGVLAVEAALVVPLLVLVAALLMTGVVAVTAQLSVIDAAREAVRLAARGETTAEAVAAARSLAPQHSTVRVVADSQRVQALVTAQVRPFPVFPALTLRSSAWAEREGR